MIPFLKSEFVSLVSFNNVDDGKAFAVEYTFDIGPRGRVMHSYVIQDVVDILQKAGAVFDHMPIEYTFDAINSKGSAVFQRAPK